MSFEQIFHAPITADHVRRVQAMRQCGVEEAKRLLRRAKRQMLINAATTVNEFRVVLRDLNRES